MVSQTETKTAYTAPEARQKDTTSNATTGASAAGVRAISAQLISFYFRTPVKAFFRTRVDYLAFARAINPRVQANEAWSWRMSTPGLLAHAVRTYGWQFIPNQVLPPLAANVTVGAVLYTSYLQFLGKLHEPSSQPTRCVYPPPDIQYTFIAGFAAGSIQSLVAAPLDALQVRLDSNDILTGRHKNMWRYGGSKLRELGLRGVLSGWGLSFLKDSFGYGVFFATFEYIKAQSYYTFVTNYYGSLRPRWMAQAQRQGAEDETRVLIIKPHFALEPTFLMLAGICASILQQAVQHPLNLVQSIHLRQLELLDLETKLRPSRREMLGKYYQAYKTTCKQCQTQAKQSGGWQRWLYRGFLFQALKQVPSTSAGLVIFELVRRRYGNEAQAVRIEKDGYDILV